jgi:hypothetical protein
VEEKSLPASNAISEVVVMMLGLHRVKIHVQMELCQFCRLADKNPF